MLFIQTVHTKGKLDGGFLHYKHKTPLGKVNIVQKINSEGSPLKYNCKGPEKPDVVLLQNSPQISSLASRLPTVVMRLVQSWLLLSEYLTAVNKSSSLVPH